MSAPYGNIRIYNSGRSDEELYIEEATGNLAIGFTAPIAKVDIEDAAIGKALVILNEKGDQNILTASASGVTKFYITRAGNIVSATGAMWLPINDSTMALGIGDSGGTAVISFDTANRRVGIGTTAPNVQLDVSAANPEFRLSDITSSAKSLTIEVDANVASFHESATGMGVTPLAIDLTNTRVGIGTTAPAVALDVVGSANIGTDAGTNTIKILNGGAAASVLLLRDNGAAPTVTNWVGGALAIGASSASATSGRIWIQSGSTKYTFKSSGASIADYSEFMLQDPVGGSEPGDVMVLKNDGSGKVTKGSTPYDNRIMGPSTIMGTSYNNLDEDVFYGSGSHADDPKWVDVGMLGQTYVKVSMENGVISAGDPVTTSTVAGVAMKATQSGRIIGFAMQPWDGSQTRDARAPQQGLPPGVGMILVMVRPSWYDISGSGNMADYNITGILSYPNGSIDGLAGQSIGGGPSEFEVVDKNGQKVADKEVLSEALIGNLRSGLVATQELQVGSGLTVIGSDGLPKVRFDNNGDATFNGTLTADTIKAKHIEGLEILTDRISSLSQGLSSLAGATESAVLGTSTSSGVLLGSATLDNVQVKFDMAVLGKMTVNGALMVGDLAHFQGETIFDRLATFIERVVFRGDIDILGRPTFNKDTAGTAVIGKGAQEVAVLFEREYKESPLVTATISFDRENKPEANISDSDWQAQVNAREQAILDSDLRFIVSDKTTRGFVIKLNKPAGDEVRFSWTAIAVMGATVSRQMAGPSSSPSSTLEPATPVPTATISPATPTPSPTITPLETQSPTSVPSPEPTASPPPSELPTPGT